MHKPMWSWKNFWTRVGRRPRRRQSQRLIKTRPLQLQQLEPRQLLTTDLALSEFTSDHDELLVSYEVTGADAAAMDLQIGRSSDGMTVDDVLLTRRVDDPAALSVGTHTVSIDADFIDVAEDYQLVVQLDASDENAEADETNNAGPFGGGVFLGTDGTVHIHGTAAADDWLLTDTGGTSLEVQLGGSPLATLTSYMAVHVRSHGGDDTVTLNSSGETDVPLWAFGGSGLDALTGGAGDDLLDGGAGPDTLRGNAGSDTLLGNEADDRRDGGPGLDSPELIDDGYGTGFTATSGWSNRYDAAGFQDDWYYATAGDGMRQATYNFTELPAGRYRVWTSWAAGPDRATNTPFEIFEDHYLLDEVRVDQQHQPAGEVVEGVTWQGLGEYDIQSGQLKVRVRDDANGLVVADVIRLERLSELPAAWTIDNIDAGFSLEGGGWTSATNTVAYRDTQYYCAPGSGQNVARWTFDLVEPGKAYEVLASWTAYSNRATNAPYSVFDDSTRLATVRVSQEIEPDDATARDQGWESLGVFTIQGDKLVVELSDDANDYVIADAIRVVEVAQPASTPLVLNEDQLGFTTGGDSWQKVDNPAAYQGDHRYHAPGTGSNYAQWEFVGLNPARSYQVYATWLAYENRASDTPYEIADDAKTLATVRLNQRIAPDDDTFDDWGWESLGVFTAAAGTLRVRLSDDANGYVMADAIRLVEVPREPSPEGVVDDGDAAYWQWGEGWVNASNETAYHSDLRYHAPGSGSERARWTFDHLVPGARYHVLATWPEHENRASDAPFTIFEDFAPVSTTRINQQVAPDDVELDGRGWESLGTVRVFSPTLSVELADNANGYVIADAVRLVRVPADAQPAALVDEGDVDHAFSGEGWVGATNTVSYQDDLRYHAAGDGSAWSRWTLGGLTPGDAYEVFATWAAHENRASDAPYRVTDGATIDTTVAVNQRLAPADETFDDQPWHSLGTFVPGTSRLNVQLTNAANGYVIADAVRVVHRNHAPEALGIGNISVQEDAPATEIDLLAAFSDGEDAPEALTYTLVANSQPELVDAAILTSAEQLVLSCLPLAVGSARIVVRATDTQGLSIDSTVVVEVGPINDPPQVTKLWDAPDPSIEGARLLLQATGVNDDNGVVSVWFWRDVDGNGLLEPTTDHLLGTDDDGTDGWGVSLVTSGFGPGPQTYFAQAIDEQGLQSNVVQATGELGVVAVLDDTGPGYEETGTGWAEGNSAEAFNDAYRQHTAGTGQSTAHWTFDGLKTGPHRVFVTWVPGTDRASNAPFTIYNGSTQLETIPVNQRETPAGLFDHGVWWKELGQYNLQAGSLSVELSDAADGLVVADAIRVLDPPPTISWLSTSPEPVVTGADFTLTAHGVNDADGTVEQVAFYRDADGDGLLDTSLDEHMATDTSSAGGWSATLSSVGLATGEHTFFAQATDDDTLTSTPVSVAGYITELPQSIDDGQPGHAEAGQWITGGLAGGYDGDYRFSHAGDGSHSTTWTFDSLEPNRRYRVYATWVPDPVRASDSPYTILDGSTTEAIVRVDQRAAPDDATLDAHAWENLGVYSVESGTLVVTLSDDADGQVCADAIRLEEVPPPPQVIDDRHTDYQEVGQNWITGSLEGGYEDRYRFSHTGTGADTASWTFDGLESHRRYEVFTTWVPDPARATNSPFTIYDGTTARNVVRLNQEVAPNDATFDNHNWESLGVYTVDSGTLVVQLSDDANDQVCADAVWVVEVPAAAMSSDNSEPTYTESGDNWINGSLSGGYQGGYRFSHSGDGSDTASWAFEYLESDKLYRLYATWVPDPARATNSPYTIFDGSTSMATARVNQQLAPDYATIDDHAWANLGVYRAESGALVVSLSDDADGQVCADAVRLVEVIESPHTADNGDPSYQEFGAEWVNGGLAGGYGGGYRFSEVGTGSDMASWTFASLRSDQLYEVFAAWVPAPSRATNAPFTVRDGRTVDQTVAVNQQLVPNDFEHDGFQWESLGVYRPASGMLEVQLSDNADGEVCADAIHLVEVPVAPEVVDNGDPVYAEVGDDWHHGSLSGGYQGGYRFSYAGSGDESASWTFETLHSGRLYEVWATWVPDPARATDAPYTILDDDAVQGVARVNQEVAPTGSNYDGHTWQSLGIYRIDSGRLAVQLSDDANGQVCADSVRLVELTKAPETVDNSDLAYAEIGGDWHQGMLQGGYQGGYHFSYAGTGEDYADWQFESLPTGVSYELFATWVPDPARATNSPYTIYDGNEPIATVRVDQQVAPDGATSDDHTWQSLGIYLARNGSLRVRLSDDANGQVCADAVRAVAVPPAPEVVDNGDESYVESGDNWNNGSLAGGYEGGYRFSQAGTGEDTATWTFENLAENGLYRVLATWVPDPVRATNSPYTIADGAAIRTTVRVDHRLAPNDATLDDHAWENLGVYRVENGSLVVTLSDDADGQVCADAVRVVEIDEASPIADETDITYAEAGEDWYRGSLTGGYQGVYRFSHAGTGDHTATWSFDGLESQQRYQVFTTWVACSVRATNSPFSVLDGDVVEATVALDQTVSPDDFTYNNHAWESLGVYTLDSGVLRVQSSNEADGQVCADAVWIAREGAIYGLTSPTMVTAGADVALTAQVIDPDHTAVQSVAFYRDRNASGVLEEALDELIGVDSESADGWSIAAPTIDLPEGTSTYFAQSYTADGVVNWQASDVEIVEGDAISDDGDSGYAELSGTWSGGTLTPEAAFGDDYRQAYLPDGPHETRWQFDGLEPGKYEVYTTHVAAANHTQAAAFTVYDGDVATGQQLATAMVDQSAAPDDETYLDHAWELLGGVVLTGNTLSVKLTADGTQDAWAVADAVLIRRVPNLTLSGDAEVTEGGTYTLQLDSDGFAMDQWTIDWGDGHVETLPGNPTEATHTYADGPGNFSITATADYQGDTYETAAGGHAGELDPSFGDGGKVVTDFAEDGDYPWASDVAMLPNGKIIIAGHAYNANGDRDFALALHETNGSLDSSFGSGGRVMTDFAGGSDRAYAVVVDGDSKILVAGYAGGFALARYNVDGSLDASFGSGGLVVTDFDGVSGSASSVAIDNQGRLVVAGSVGGDFALARFEDNGELDYSFSEDGKVVLDLEGYNDRASSVVVGANDAVLVGGKADLSDGTSDFALARYDSAGNLDTAFGTGGKVLTNVHYMDDGWEYANAVAIDSQENIVVAGGAYWAAFDIALARYHSDGSLDDSFSEDGKLVADLAGNPSWDDLADVTVDTAGRILTAGYIETPTSCAFLLAQFKSDGTLDTEFSDDGIVAIDFVGDYGSAEAMAMDSHGRLVLAGQAGGGFALARVFGSGSGISHSVTVNNVAPTLAQPADQTVEPGQLLSITDLGQFTDPGFDNPQADPATVETFTYSIDWGDGSDPDTGTATIDQAGSPGTLTAGSFDGSHTYADWGLYTVTMTLTDDDGGQDSKTLEIAVGNSAPTIASAIPDVTVNEDAVSTQIELSSVFTDVDVATSGDTLTFSVQSNTATGTVSNQIAGATLTLEYLSDQHGTGEVTVRATDLCGAWVEDTFAVVVLPVNDAPVAVLDTYTVNEGEALVVLAEEGLLENDSDIESDTLSVVLLSDVSHGSLTLFGEGLFVYVPDLGFHGTDSFEYQLNDGHGGADTALVTISVVDAADAPEAVVDRYLIQQDASLDVPAVEGVLANDTDPDGEALLALVESAPSHGTLQLNPDGSFIYTPTAGFFGPDYFTYRASDGVNQSAVAVVTLWVGSSNEPPIVGNDSYAATEDGILTVAAGQGLLVNDSDPNGNPMEVSLVTPPAKGLLTLEKDGGFTFRPGRDVHGEDSFVYQVADGFGGFALGSVALAIAEVNDDPITTDDAYETAVDTRLVIDTLFGVLNNDTDVDEDSLLAAVDTNPSHGALSLQTDGSLTYTPDTGFVGTDQFTYQTSDSLGGTATGTVRIAVGNSAPVTADDSFTTNEDTVLIVDVGEGVLANDTNADNDRLSTLVLTVPSHGSLSLAAHGGFTYIPDPNYHGTDVFTYQVRDPFGASSSGTVTLVVNPINDDPRAVVDDYEAELETMLSIPALAGVLANDTDADSDPLTAALVSGPEHGTLALNSDGSFDYMPEAGFLGIDSFSYQAEDGGDSPSETRVTIVVVPPNSAPVSANESFVLDEDTPLALFRDQGVLANDSDPEDDSLEAVLLAGPMHGELALLPDGSLVYVPDANYYGEDSFSYQASDGALLSGSTSATLTIEPINDAPVATEDSYTVAEDSVLTVGPAEGVLANDTDVEMDTLTAFWTVLPVHGSLDYNADGSFTYTPTNNFKGSDSFTYKVSDGPSHSDEVTVSLIVTAVNDTPIAVDDSASTPEDTPRQIDVLANDSDAEGEPLTITIIEVANGTAIVDDDNTPGDPADDTVIFTPDVDFFGTAEITYRVSDGQADSAPAIVTISVAARNDVPVAMDDTAETANTANVNIDVLANDVDPEGQPLQIVSAFGAVGGTAAINDGGTPGDFTDDTVDFTPTPGFHGIGSFVYRVSDGAQAEASVRIAVDPGTGAPVAADDNYVAEEGIELVVGSVSGVLGNDSDPDGDPISAELVVAPENGTVVLNGNGSFSYTSAPDFNGEDSFTYRAVDNGLLSNVATVTLTVNPSNDPPVAVNDDFVVNSETAELLFVEINDTDADDDVLTVIDVDASGCQGAVSITEFGSIEYDPNGQFDDLEMDESATETFTYTVDDGQGGTDSATVTLTVTREPPEMQILCTNLWGISSSYQLIDYWEVPLNVPIVETLSITNLGRGVLNLSSLWVTSGLTLLSTFEPVLEFGETTTLVVAMDTSEAGWRNEYVTFSSNDPAFPLVDCHLRANFLTNTGEAKVTDFRLVNDTGSSNTDRFTTDARVAGALHGDFENGSAAVQFSIDADNSTIAKEIRIPETGGEFIFDPWQVDASLLGEVPLSYRWVTRMRGTERFGDWIDYPITLAEDVTAGVARVEDFRLFRDTYDDDDLLSYNPKLLGVVKGEFWDGHVVVEFAHDSDLDVDGSAEVAEAGTKFLYDPRVSDPLFVDRAGSEVTVWCRPVNYDGQGVRGREGEWVEFTFDYDVEPICSIRPTLRLLHDTPVAIDVVVDPSLTGSARAFTIVQFDHDEDGVLDGSTFTDAEGDFVYTPAGLPYGTEVAIRARSAWYDGYTPYDPQSPEQPIYPGDGMFRTCAWSTEPCRFVLQSTVPPDVVALELADSSVEVGASTADATVFGQLDPDADNLGSFQIQFDHNADDGESVDGITWSDETGHFVYVPEGLPAGETTIAARAARWDDRAGMEVWSAWFELEINYEPLPAAVVSELQLAVEDDGYVRVTVDDEDSEFAAIATDWTMVDDDAAHLGGYHQYPVGNGQHPATWEFNNLRTDTDYELLVTWVPGADRATDVPYSLLDGGLLEATVTVDQTAAPDDLFRDGVYWKSLGIFHVDEAIVTIRINDRPSGVIVADAVRLVEVGSRTLDESSPDTSLAGDDWVETAAASALGGKVQTHVSGTGENTAQWHLGGLRPGERYQVLTTWAEAPDRATDAPYTVSDGGSKLETVRVNQQLAPQTAEYDDVSWHSLGTYYCATGSLTVELSDDANGLVVADGVRVVQLPLTIDDPTVIGKLSGAEELGNLEIQFDHDGDGSADGYAFSSDTGEFAYEPVGLLPGTVVLTACAVEPGRDMGDYAPANYQALAFTLAPPANDAAWVTGLDLVQDDGELDDDRVTSNPTVTGQIVNDGPVAYLTVQLDYDGVDGADDSVTADSTGRFMFAPEGLDLGSVTFKARVREWNYTTRSYDWGPWAELPFTLEEPVNAPPTVDSLSLYCDTGPNPGFTANAWIKGQAANADGDADRLRVEFDHDSLDGIDEVHGVTFTDENGVFYYDPSPLSYADAHLQARAAEWDPVQEAWLVGGWTPIDFTYEEQSGVLPELTDLDLADDTGEPDGHTTDPTVTGRVLATGLLEGLTVEIDFDALDGVDTVDATTTTDRLGRFSFSADTLAVGDRHLQFRAFQVDTVTRELRTSVWMPFSFTYDELVDEPPAIAELHLQSDLDDTGLEPRAYEVIVAGTVTNDTGAELLVEFDHAVDGLFDGVVDGSTWADAEGHFVYSTDGLDVGEASIRARAKEYGKTGAVQYGQWTTLEFTFEEAQSGSFEVAELVLACGTDYTTNPTVSGQLGGSGPRDEVTIELDWTGDGAADAETTTDDTGYFEYMPEGLDDGFVTVQARAVDDSLGWNQYGEWTSLTFVLYGTVLGYSEARAMANGIDQFEAANDAADARYDDTLNTAETGFDQQADAVNTRYDATVASAGARRSAAESAATNQYRTALTGADATFKSALTTASSDFADALSQFSGDTTSFIFRDYLWPDAPNDNAVQLPSAASMPQPPAAPTYAGPTYPLASDPTYRQAIAQANQVYYNLVRAADAQLTQDKQSAGLQYEQEKASAHAAYQQAMADATEAYHNALANATPPVDMAEAVREYNWGKELVYAEMLNANHEATEAYSAAHRTADRERDNALAALPDLGSDPSWGAVAARHAKAHKIEIRLHDEPSIWADRERSVCQDEAKYTYQKRLLELTETLDAAQAEYDHWKEQIRLAAQRDFEKAKASATSSLESALAASEETQSQQLAAAQRAHAEARADATGQLWCDRAAAAGDALSAWDQADGSPWTAYQKQLADHAIDYVNAMAGAYQQREYAHAVAGESESLALALAAKDRKSALATAKAERETQKADARFDYLSAVNDARRERAVREKELLADEKIAFLQATRDLTVGRDLAAWEHAKDSKNNDILAFDELISYGWAAWGSWTYDARSALEGYLGRTATRERLKTDRNLRREYYQTQVDAIQAYKHDYAEAEQDWLHALSDAACTLESAAIAADADYAVAVVSADAKYDIAAGRADAASSIAIAAADRSYYDAAARQEFTQNHADAKARQSSQQSVTDDYLSRTTSWDAAQDSDWSEFQLALAGAQAAEQKAVNSADTGYQATLGEASLKWQLAANQLQLGYDAQEAIAAASQNAKMQTASAEHAIAVARADAERDTAAAEAKTKRDKAVIDANAEFHQALAGLEQTMHSDVREAQWIEDIARTEAISDYYDLVHLRQRGFRTSCRTTSYGAEVECWHYAPP